MKNVIFDWSGTLVDDLPPVLEATNRIFAHYRREEMDREELAKCLKVVDGTGAAKKDDDSKEVLSRLARAWRYVECERRRADARAAGVGTARGRRMRKGSQDAPPPPHPVSAPRPPTPPGPPLCPPVHPPSRSLPPDPTREAHTRARSPTRHAPSARRAAAE